MTLSIILHNNFLVKKKFYFFCFFNLEQMKKLANRGKQWYNNSS